MRKRLLSLALALVLSLGLTVPAAAAGATLTEVMSVETYASFLEGLGGYVYGIRGFHDGITWHGAPIAHSYGAFDANGKVIVEPNTYWEVLGFSEGVAWAKRNNQNTWTAVDNTGRELFTLSEELEPVYGSDGISNFHDGLAKVRNRETNTYGYVDKTGKTVIPFEHNDRAGDFHDGLAVVYDSAKAYYGYMDKTGKVVIPCQYASAGDFVNGVAPVSLGSRGTYIDTTGKDLLPQEYKRENNYYISDVLLAYKSVYEPGGGYAFFNKSGQIVSSGYGISNYSNGMYCVGKDGQYGFVNEAGVLVIPCTLPDEGTFLDGYALIYTGDRGVEGSYNIIDKTGKVTGSWTRPEGYDGGPAAAGNGCFIVQTRESYTTRYGFIDYTGREIVSPKYKKVEDFSGGVAAVMDFDEKWGFVDTTGTEIMPCQYTEIRYTAEPGVFEAEKKVGGEWHTQILKSSGWTEPAVSGTTPSTPAKPAGPSANPTNSKVLVNGKEVAFDAYTIDGSNYFKLRDLAFVLNGTEKQFEVGWDNASKTITLTSGSAYTANGSEMAKGSGTQSASVSASKLLIDGKEVSLTAYTIGGNNYFKLRDIGQAFDFGIGWDNASKTITIDTSTGYTA